MLPIEKIHEEIRKVTSSTDLSVVIVLIEDYVKENCKVKDQELIKCFEKALSMMYLRGCENCQKQILSKERRKGDSMYED